MAQAQSKSQTSIDANLKASTEKNMKKEYAPIPSSTSLSSQNKANPSVETNS